MSTDKQNLIYIYDTDHQKIIMIDGETGEQVDTKDDRVTALLKHLNKNNHPILLRKFAVWCVRQINSDMKPIQKKILELAEKAIQQQATEDELRELYEETEATAIATDTVGLRQGEESAPAYLAARECINPNVLEGAVQAARFHRVWAEIMHKNDEEPVLKEVKAKAAKDVVHNVEQQQTDYLLDLMNE